MPIAIFEYRLRKARGADVSGTRYDVSLLARTPEQPEQVLDTHTEIGLGPQREFRLSMSVAQINASSVRLRVARSSQPGSAVLTGYARLQFNPGHVPQRFRLGILELDDPVWSVSGEVVPGPGFPAALDSLTVLLRVVSGEISEEPVTVSVDSQGDFAFEGRRLALEPRKEAELRMVVLHDTGEEAARYYRATRSRRVTDCRIRLGVPFLDVWGQFTGSHPRLAAKLEQLRYEPKAAHKGTDTWYGFRRYRTLQIAQVGEGWVGRAAKGPVGDPDWVWDVALDPIYDSPDGFLLPNEKNRRKHGHGRGHGIHVEACESLSRKSLEDGLTADAASVPATRRVWMLGTHVFDDAWDFGSPDHEHNELHPLYVMRPCMGGWFHFAVAESIAIAPQAREAMGLEPGDEAPAQVDGWPRASTDPADYAAAYLLFNPQTAANAVYSTCVLVIDFYRNSGMHDALAKFYARAAVRYAAHGIDFGAPSNPTSAAVHEAHARDRIASGRPGLLRDDLFERLMKLYNFLHGPASHAASPVSGLAPQSYLRCVYAIDSMWAAENTGGEVGQHNPRVSLNRAGSRKLDELRLELGRMYADLFEAVDDPEERARLFAEAVHRYRSWGVPATPRRTEEWDSGQLAEHARGATANQLAGEMRVRVNSFWNALTPHVQL